MTKDKEQQLLEDVAQIKVMLATHLDEHKERRGQVPTWVGIIVSASIGLVAIFKAAVK